MLTAALAVGALLAGPPSTADRDFAVPPTTLTLAHARMRVTQGGQRVRVTIPVTPGTNAYGDTLSYEWNTRVDGGKRCQPGALPDLGRVTAGTVIDAPLPRPAKSWCRGLYGADLIAVITLNCDNDPPPDCREWNPSRDSVAGAVFDVGPSQKTICHQHGQVQRCWIGPSYRSRAMWSVRALLDDLLGPDGATSEADPYFERAFRDDRGLRDDWETDDNDFFGDPDTRSEAIRMSKIVDRVLRSGPFHGKTWPGRTPS